MSTDAFTKAFPGRSSDLPVPAKPAATGATEDELRTRQEQIQLFNMMEHIRGDIRSQILDAVDHIYLDLDVPHPLFGLGSMDPHALLQYLIFEYGSMTPADYERNMDRLETVVDLQHPFKKWFADARDIKAIASSEGRPIHDQTVITRMLRSFKNSGLHQALVTDWGRLPKTIREGQAAWKSFHDHCTTYEKARIEETTTATDLANGARQVTPERTNTRREERSTSPMDTVDRTHQEPPTKRIKIGGLER